MFSKVLFAFVSAALLMRCSAESRNGSETTSLDDTESLVARSDGRFTATCKDGHTEIVTQAQILENRVCEPGGNGGQQQAACAEKAHSGPFSRSESIELCQGATSLEPANCGIKAYNGPFSKSEAITLCKRARTSGRVACALKAHNGPFTRSESVYLCERAESEEVAQCAIDAYYGPYSREEAIQLCRP